MKDEYLQETLARLGVDGPKLADFDVLASSAPDRGQNAHVYDQCNELVLSELRKRSLGPVFHVTGEMRAVSDPKHRLVCRISTRHYGMPPIMLANLPGERRRKGREVWRWNTENWPQQTWQNHLDVFHLFAAQEMAVYALASSEEMHFSLFGESHVLLQEKHDHRTHTKRVWLVKSQALREALLPRVKRCFDSAVEVPARVFQNFVSLLSDPLHLDLLFQLEEGGSVSPEKFRGLCDAFNTSFEEVAADLSTVGFVSGEGVDVRITGAGKEFLEIFGKR